MGDGAKAAVATVLTIVGLIAGLYLFGAAEWPVSLNSPQVAPSVKWQKTLDDGLALEAMWSRAKSGKEPLAFPPDPAAIDRVDRAIGEIPQDWEKAEDAIALVMRLRAERPAIAKAYQAADEAQRARLKVDREKSLLEKRRRAADILETTFLDAGRDVYVKSEGKELRTLRVKYILMSRPLVYKFQQDYKTRETLRDLGFTKLIFTDGYNDTWTMVP